ncbi:MAG: tyrosyl-tRNA synthetase [Rickettsiaceae bacterium]|jgi:tyrosyl-tRNA synthetase|nr:tyrosyl-tRNA synthetase [Rickettsiaceae bacterium]
MTKSFIKEFQDRGYFYQCTNLEALSEISSKQNITAYIGFDCTARSLHVGNLMQIMILRLLQRYGHKPIIIIGDTTTKIGDPTGKDEMRKILSDEDLKLNMQGIKECLAKFIKFGDGPSDAIMLTNSDWLEKLNYIDFLRNFGRLISVNRMLSQESVKFRLEREQNLSFLEFNYMLFQGYDFYHLNKYYNCALQIGGSDQWGNIISGVELTRKASNKEVFGLTTPLLTTSSGMKMGKSVGGAVWIHENMLSPYEYFQYWRNIEDPDVIKFSKLFAEYNDVEQQEFNLLAEQNINEAKKQLAHRLTGLCHGMSAADEARETAIRVFEQGGTSDGLPEHIINRSMLEKGITAYELFAEAGLSESKSEARKLIRGGGAKINDIKIEDENQLITSKNLNSEGGIKLSAGKKRHILVKLQ